jgi:ribosomal protein S18 acetylase RimI-like enzyme
MPSPDVPQRPVVIRPFDRVADRDGLDALDTAFETARVLDVVVGARRIELVERALAVPRVKRYPIDDVFAHWSTWDTAFVAADDRICGLAAVQHQSWHARLVLWHLYVASARRRQGIGRALLARVEQHGRAIGARRVWLETSSINLPAITAYTRLGYALCGADTMLYDGTPEADEAAIYLSKAL